MKRPDVGLADLIAVLYIIGIGAFCYGISLVYWPAGLISLGMFLILTAVWLRR